MGKSTGYIFRFHWLCAYCKKSNVTEFKKRFIPLSFYQDAKKALEEYNSMQSQLYETIDDALNILGEGEHHHGLVYLGETFEEAAKTLFKSYAKHRFKLDNVKLTELELEGMTKALRECFHDELECLGCLIELQMAKKELVVGLARVDGEVCTHCDGIGNEPEPYKITINPNGSECKHYAICHKCKGTGVNEGYLPPSWRKTRQFAAENRERLKKDDTSSSNP